MIAQFDAKSPADEIASGVDLMGERCLVTRVSSGIGLETPVALVSRSAGLVGAVRDRGKSEEATSSIRDVASQNYTQWPNLL
jgi:NAD(P)-dependent dehydrogenase (short-subunit alcohol dehydrogenase family)